MTAMNVNSNSLLAKLLATENITVQHKSGIKTAMFDLKHRVLMLPVWENISTDLEHLLLGHETGHALDTPDAETYKKAYETIAQNIFGSEVPERLMSTVRGFLNVIEDARIDKRQKRRYPGLRKNYLLGYKELIERDFFGTKNRDINSMNFIDRLNLYFKGGSIHYNINFSAAEKALLKRVENLETFNECVLLTEEVYRHCKNVIENNDFEDDLIVQSIAEENDQDEYDEYDEFRESDNSNGSGDSDDSDNESDDDSKQDTNRRGTSGQGDIAPINSKGAGFDQSQEDNVPQSETDNAWQEKIQSLVRDDYKDYVYLNLPEVDMKKAVHDYKKVLNDWRSQQKSGSIYNYFGKSISDYRKEMMEWRQSEKDAISFLVKEFEQRKSAEIYSRISIAKTGVIDTNKLHSYRYNDDIFRRLSVIPEGKNHGFIMFLDWSGSMDPSLKDTIKQLLTLILFCKQIQVPFEVYTFKDSGAETPWIYDENQKNVLDLGNICLRQVLSSRMNISELNDAMTYLWAMGHGARIISDGLGGTPLNEALILAPKLVNEFRSKFKLEIVNTIVLTDGDSNGFSGVKNEKFNDQLSSKYRKFFFNDKETGKTFDIEPYGWGEGSRRNTNTLLTLLKAKTDSNLIGFFLWDEPWHNFVYRFGISGNADYHRSVTKFWKENKFYSVKSAGYDEYYVIDVKSLRKTDNELNIDTKVQKTTRQMAKVFSKFASKKAVNRVLLRQFIINVTKQAKKIA